MPSPAALRNTAPRLVVLLRPSITATRLAVWSSDSGGVGRQPVEGREHAPVDVEAGHPAYSTSGAATSTVACGC